MHRKDDFLAAAESIAAPPRVVNLAGRTPTKDPSYRARRSPEVKMAEGIRRDELDYYVTRTFVPAWHYPIRPSALGGLVFPPEDWGLQNFTNITKAQRGRLHHASQA